MNVSPKKLRFLITLHVLYKHTDKNHRMNSKRLNDFLRPYGVESGNSALGDTIDVLRAYGLDVQTHGTLNKHGVWMQERPLSEVAMQQLIFAITTNPFFSTAQKDELLEHMKPLVTVYQEPLLHNNVQNEDGAIPLTPDQIEAFAVIHEAICSGKRIRIEKKKEKKDGNIKNRTVVIKPTNLCVKNGEIITEGYNAKRKENEILCLSEFDAISLTR